MKKILLLLLAVCCSAVFVGCGANNAASDSPEAGTPLSTFYDAVLAAQAEDAEPLIFFEESNPDLIASFYPGLDSIDLAQQAFYMPPIVTAPCEIVLAEVKNSDDAQAVADIFRSRIEQGAANTTYPDSAAGWQKNAQVQRSGNFICMIVLPDGYTIPENVFQLP